MASLPSQHPHLALHLSDQEIDPHILQSLSLAHLTTTALASYDTAKRLDHGAPLRTMVEHAGAGPVVLHSYLCPISERQQPRQVAHLVLEENGLAKNNDGDDDGDGPNAPPMLITTVVAPGAEEIRDARRAAGRLERIARVFQTDWAAEGGDAT
ncbi:hypothetical protein M406DRAFT_296749 [Cryphonectria parasitica EP155]|uniref:Uncharacterized protein n=1 Tax=Cryphonectria parasitica (strain ATCC 38755 / EP155) TaxID=660469 RepID=A0A9P4XUQ1_CRYP1|nr:uncharacterized protein M406DRAFT_296749 [Cryphonectria parasitica EP155]KAF3761171.1 hypothetical protein M406DRAFT_296749 [Cryphonectria parasitica EP155]